MPLSTVFLRLLFELRAPRLTPRLTPLLLAAEAPFYYTISFTLLLLSLPAVLDDTWGLAFDLPPPPRRLLDIPRLDGTTAETADTLVVAGLGGEGGG